MEEVATVVGVKGNKAEVKIVRHSACSKCKNKCSLAESHEEDEIIVEVDNIVGVKEGEQVLLEINESNVLFASLIIYLTPLLFMISGYFIVSWLAQQLGIQAGEGAGIIGTIVFFFLSFLLIKVVNPFLEKKPGFKPVVKKVK